MPSWRLGDRVLDLTARAFVVAVIDESEAPIGDAVPRARDDGADAVLLSVEDLDRVAAAVATGVPVLADVDDPGQIDALAALGVAGVWSRTLDSGALVEALAATSLSAVLTVSSVRAQEVEAARERLDPQRLAIACRAGLHDGVPAVPVTAGTPALALDVDAGPEPGDPAAAIAVTTVALERGWRILRSAHPRAVSRAARVLEAVLAARDGADR